MASSSTGHQSGASSSSADNTEYDETPTVTDPQTLANNDPEWLLFAQLAAPLGWPVIDNHDLVELPMYLEYEPISTRMGLLGLDRTIWGTSMVSFESSIFQHHTGERMSIEGCNFLTEIFFAGPKSDEDLRPPTQGVDDPQVHVARCHCLCRLVGRAPYQSGRCRLAQASHNGQRITMDSGRVRCFLWSLQRIQNIHSLQFTLRDSVERCLPPRVCTVGQ
jgi:hypothetical protein